jgi:acyl dehydratase
MVDEIRVGGRASRTLAVGDEHIELFARLTGDRNPLHFDDEFAGATRFGRRVVQGGVTTGLLNAIVAMDLPGPGSVFMEQQLRYLAPVHPGDTITAEATITSIHATKPVYGLAVRVVRQDGVVVLEGTAVVYRMRPTG